MTKKTSIFKFLTATALLLFEINIAQATTLTISSDNTGGKILFDSGRFSFTSAGFGVTGTAPLWTGDITGSFTIDSGSITTTPTGEQTANIIGSKPTKFTIDDKNGGTLSGDISFTKLHSYTNGIVGAIETEGLATLTINNYTGIDKTLQSFASGGSAIPVIAFTFIPGQTVTQLAAASNLSTSYSGTITTVPLPAAAWLFGSAMLGATALGRRSAIIRKGTSAT